jgi:hypothetical protein
VTEPPREWSDDETLGFFNRHFVPIQFDVRLGDQRKRVLWSAFPLSIRNRWLLMTAGHCIDEMKEWRAAGSQIERARLMDGLNASAKHLLSVPFDYDSFHPAKLGPDITHDYGILIPNDLAIRSMLSNGVVPFTEKAWDDEDHEFDFYKVLGAPAALVRAVDNDATSIGTMFASVDRLKDRPEDLPETTAPTFYGELCGDPGIKLKGMSGGPILGFFTDDNGRHFRLVAMQVSALRGKYVAGYWGCSPITECRSPSKGPISRIPRGALAGWSRIFICTLG